MTSGLVTVFGGTGFLGRRIVEHLAKKGFQVRIATRHPERAETPPAGIEAVRADVRDDASVAAALAGAGAAVNAVALYVEHGDVTFKSIHVEGARRVAALAAEAGIARLVHISGIGADAQSDSAYVACRAQGEQAVRAAFPAATILRPSVMFGPDDAFLTTLYTLVRRLPVLPLFGDGGTRLQPVHVADVAEAVARVCAADRPGDLYELGGPHVYRYRELLQLLARRAKRRRLLLPFPLALWTAMAILAKPLPNPPITRGQIALMRRDNVVAPEAASFTDLGITPRALEDHLPGA